MANTERPRPQKEANRLSNLLRLVLGDDRFPVDIEALAREVSKNNEDPIEKIVGVEIDGFEGMLRPHKKRPSWHIIYNTNPRYKGRVRFTKAHELGHYLLHRPQLTSAHYQSGASTEILGFECKPLRSNSWQEEEKIREEEADTFASYVLMPIDDYREQVNGEEITVDLINHITNRYGVSLIAACRKWIEFTTTRAAMIVARDGFALWGRASKSALKSGVFIRSGMVIPENALACANYSSRGFSSDIPVRRPEGIWTFSRGTEPVRELVLVSEFLDISITILQFEQDVDHVAYDDVEPWDSFDQFNSKKTY